VAAKLPGSFSYLMIGFNCIAAFYNLFSKCLTFQRTDVGTLTDKQRFIVCSDNGIQMSEEEGKHGK